LGGEEVKFFALNKKGEDFFAFFIAVQLFCRFIYLLIYFYSFDSLLAITWLQFWR
jgi:hypothetical protein